MCKDIGRFHLLIGKRGISIKWSLGRNHFSPLCFPCSSALVLVANEEIQGLRIKHLHLGGELSLPEKPNSTRKITKLMMDITMVCLSRENPLCLAAMEAPSHSLELMGWERPQVGGILWFSDSGSGLGGKFVVLLGYQLFRPSSFPVSSLTIMR